MTRAPQRRWTPEQDARLCAMWAKGEPIRFIADALKRTPPTIHSRVQHLRANGVKLTPRKACVDVDGLNRIIEREATHG